ncbi:MAG: 16S rRNA (guanine(527)-N(7))-methyltransferase RsmG [Campylobacterota bacterium]|nr:16S rRNA (guanine(527)-N(7))-methyltransferase RsmG [Campylobacterota bacterium]
MLKEKLKKIDLEFDDIFYERCDKFIVLLQQWGAVHSMTAQLTNDKIEDNIVDSVYPIKFLNNFESIIDIGTGAGYPGMLLAIARPEAKVVLCEPKAKRVAFLNFVKNALKLVNVEVLQNRVENMPPQSFDLITSRAVTNTSLLFSLTQNLKSEDTEYLFYKGTLCEDEIKELTIENYDIIKVGDHRNYLYMKRKGLFDDI